MTRYPRQVDREYLSCRSGGLHKIQMIDGGTLDLHQDLVACDRRRRYIAEHQLPTVFQHSDNVHASSSCTACVNSAGDDAGNQDASSPRLAPILVTRLLLGKTWSRIWPSRTSTANTAPQSTRYR